MMDNNIINTPVLPEETLEQVSGGVIWREAEVYVSEAIKMPERRVHPLKPNQTYCTKDRPGENAGASKMEIK